MTVVWPFGSFEFKFPTIDEEYETDPVNLNDSCDGLIKAFDQLSSLSRNEADCAPSNDAEHTPEVTNFKHTWVLDDCSQYDFSQPAKVKHTWSQPNAPNCKSDEPDEVIDLVNWLHSSNFREIEATANGDPVAMAKLDAEIKKNPTSQPKASL